MKNTPLYKDLDTSFVNFDALVRYLRRRKFVGEILLGSNGYEASVVFTDEGKLRVTENDKISGAIVHGEKAFDRIVARTAKPGGNIDVYRHASVAAKPATNGQHKQPVTNGKPALRIDRDKPANGIRDFLRIEPFDISMLKNNGHRSPEGPASNGKHSPGATELMTDLLGTVDAALQRAKLELEPAFAKAASEIADRHPILDPISGTVEYTGGRLIAGQDVEEEDLAAAVGEVLNRILSRLAGSPRFGKVHRFTLQRLRAFQRDRLTDLYNCRLSEMIEELVGE